MKRERGQKIMQVLFILYGICMFFLLFGRNSYNLDDSYWKSLQWKINLVPFFTIGSQWKVFVRSGYDIFSFAGINLIGNVIMFVPLGIFLPGTWRSMRSYGKFFLCVAGLILIVELVQVFTLRGSLDIDDMILNLLGASIGYVLFRGVLYFLKKKGRAT